MPRPSGSWALQGSCRATYKVVTAARGLRLVLRMKRIGTLGYIILGLITTSAFADTTSATPATTPAPAVDAAPAAKSGKHKKGGKKHGHHSQHAHKKKAAPEAEQK